MHFHPNAPAFLITGVLVAAGLVAGCGSDNNTTAPERPSSVHVLFDLNAGGQPLLTDHLLYTNPTGRLYSITKVRFVLSDVQLHSIDGDDVKLTDMHYFDLADTNSREIHFTGDMPHTEWNRITFTFGLDETRNLRDHYIDMTKFHTEMAWPAGLGADLGYHYMQLEGNYEQTPGGATAGYTTHSGAIQQVTDPQPYHYYFQVDLPVTPTHIHEGGTGEVMISFDLNDWYVDHGNNTQYDFTDYPAMIMGNYEAQAKLWANGQYCFSASMMVADH